MKALRFLRALPLAMMLFAAPVRAEQGTIVGPIVGPHTMADVMGTINASLLAIQSCNSGTAAPANGVSGLATHYQCWADTTANPVVFKRYDGASWAIWGKLDTATHLWTPSYQGTDLGTASTATTGTSGHTIPFLDGANVWSGTQTFGSGVLALTGSALGTNIAAPSSPAAGKVIFWTDSTDLRFHDKNASGVIGTTVVADTGTANNYISAISAAGAISKSRPACATLSDSSVFCSGTSAANLTGTLAAGQFPALTGDVTTSAGALATTIAANAVTNAKLATMAAYTVKANATGSSAVPTDVSIPALTQKASPVAADKIMIADSAASDALKYATVSSIASAGSVSSIGGATGAITLGGSLAMSSTTLVDAANNYLINPSGATMTAAVGSQTDGTYDFDQWLTLTQTAAITASQQTNVENTTPYMMRSLQAQASAQRFGRIQWIESVFCRDLRGQAVVLSARVRMSATTTLRYAIVEWTGTADTITKDIVLDWTSATFTTGNFFTTTSTTLVGAGSIALTANTLTDITALTGTVSSSMNNIAVFFWTDSTQAQNVTLDIGKVKLEKGSVATPFAGGNPRPLAIPGRYYNQSYSDGVAPGDTSGATTYAAFQAYGVGGESAGSYSFGARMRAVPTVTFYSPTTGTSGQLRDATTSADAASSGPNVVGQSGFSGANGSRTLNDVYRFHWVANARL